MMQLLFITLAVLCIIASGFQPIRISRHDLALDAKKSVGDLSEADLKGKRVLVRADFNVPLDKKTGKITDDTRIRGAIPTIVSFLLFTIHIIFGVQKYLVSKGAKVLLSSHLGRPTGGYEKKFSLAPVGPRLAELLGQPVPLVPDCIGVAVGAALSTLNDGDVVLLENVRFYPEEEKNDPAFAAKVIKNFLVNKQFIFLSLPQMLMSSSTTPSELLIVLMAQLRVLLPSLNPPLQDSFYRKSWITSREPLTCQRDHSPLLSEVPRCLPRSPSSKPC